MKTCISLLLALCCQSALGEYRKPGCYYADVVRVIDGDTIAVNLLLWQYPGSNDNSRVIVPINIRVAGVDTPESSARFAKCPAEIVLGKQAKQFTQVWLANHQRIVICDVERPKYAGRVVAYIYRAMNDYDLSRALIDAKLAIAYSGAKKTDWCAD